MRGLLRIDNRIVHPTLKQRDVFRLWKLPFVPENPLPPTEGLRDVDSVLIAEADARVIEEPASRTQSPELLAGGDGSHCTTPTQSVIDRAIQSRTDPRTLRRGQLTDSFLNKVRSNLLQKEVPEDDPNRRFPRRLPS